MSGQNVHVLDNLPMHIQTKYNICIQIILHEILIGLVVSSL